MTPETASVLAPAATQAWWKDSTVYQIYPRSFADSNGDGIGDLRGIINRLDYLAELGVEVLWLSPIYPSPQDDNGYDISNYRDIEPMFGTMSDFTELLEQTHARGMKLIMDLVVNHTSDEHPWFRESRDPQSPKRDWYWWRAAKPGAEPGTDAAAPTNWGSRFSGSAWEYDAVSGEYFLHIFSRRQPDLNWENPEVRAAVYEMMNWWLDLGVDGFRMDVINFISKNTDLPEAEVPAGAIYGQAREHYMNGPRLHEYLQEMYREVFAERPERLLTVGETPRVTVNDALELTDPERRELDMVFQFDHMDLDSGVDKFDPLPLDLAGLKEILGGWQRGLATTGWNSLYWNNHDQPRIVSRWGNDGEYRVRSAKMLATVLHGHRGTPYIYQGEELGMTNVGYPTIEEFRDIQSLNYYREQTEVRGTDPATVLAGVRKRSRDNGRTPMQWDGTDGAGFTTGEPWIGINPNSREINAADQVGDPESVFAHYRTLVALRKSDPILVEGVFELVWPEHPAIYAFTRTVGERGIVILANFGDEPVTLPEHGLEAFAGARLLLTNVDGTAAVLSGERTLAPWEASVYDNRG
ncbi:alpha-glucosidase [Mycetocola tolaasinivorans]|uniref:Alpha-glucosidase n=1 Tax=Mycetocola tolaasinivorans TaxID=76635 RepID=A0A3L7A3M8_9MICO|nr:alpha-glucosidase [Mycetocola tolaasinivorans]RLP74714.1 alpha-glucosidase [Mycetocola tolaasinivorans]